MVSSQTHDLDTVVSLMMRMWKLVKPFPHTPLKQRAATMLQIHSLRFLHEHSDCTMKEFSAYLGASVSSTTQLTERLVKAGAVTRKEDTQDRRIVHLHLTKKGETELEKRKEAQRARLKTLFSSLSQQDMQDFIRIQQKIITGIERTYKSKGNI